MVLPLSRAGWHLCTDEDEFDGSLGGGRSGRGTGHLRSLGERRCGDGHDVSASESRRRSQPTLGFKQDAVPGLIIPMHFTPTEVGDYEIACAELCGLGHYKMHGMVKVVSQDDFDKWIAQREAEKQ
ncbi:MAG: hypothetical protein DMG90_19805 [Acidobacteria bacterium]|nr:MAG: hypothetical protein DMG90_19805 [Acidobacteriota bacterium]